MVSSEKKREEKVIENSRMAGHNGEQVLTDVRSLRIRVIQATSTLATRSGPACMHSRALVKRRRAGCVVNRPLERAAGC